MCMPTEQMEKEGGGGREKSHVPWQEGLVAAAPVLTQSEDAHSMPNRHQVQESILEMPSTGLQRSELELEQRRYKPIRWLGGSPSSTQTADGSAQE